MNHRPVLHSSADESDVLRLLDPKPGETVLDVTLGLGGHARGFLKRVGPRGTLIGLDADEQNLRRAEENLSDLPGRKQFHHANFRDLQSLALPLVDILFADLGVSSPHFDDPERGFSFRFDAPLDLRFDRTRGRTGAELLAKKKSDEIAAILRDFGEVRSAGRLAAALAEAAKSKGTTLRTSDVRAVVERIVGYRAPSILPQVFQALRIAVNDELGALETLLDVGPQMLRPGGRFGIISYHSLEDRLVKRRFRSLTEPMKDPEKGSILRAAPFELLTPKAIKPSGNEIEENPRARSARFRVIRFI